MSSEDDLASNHQDEKNMNDDASAEDEVSHAETSLAVATEEDSHVDDERSMDTAPDQEDEDDDDDEDDEDDAKLLSTPGGGNKKANNDSKFGTDDGTPSTIKKRRVMPPSARRGRAPAVKGLTIPFRTVKKAMKLDPDIPIVQNEAAIMTTMAAELFLQSLARESQQIAKNRGRNTIRYEDVAEARSNNPSLSFLQTLIP